MKKLSAFKCTALLAGILAASAANAALVGQWSGDFFVIKSNFGANQPGALYNTAGFCIKSDNTWYLTAKSLGSASGSGKWTQSGKKIFLHGNLGRADEYMLAGELNRVDSTHLAGNWNQWTLSTNPDYRDQYFSSQLKYVGATCLPPATNAY